MVARATITRTVSVPGITLTEANILNGESGKRVSLTLPRGFMATLTTRTTNHSGLCVLEDDHDIDSDYSTVDLYSSVGVLLVKNCDVTSVANNLITFDGTAVGGGMPNTPGLDFVCSKQASAALVIPETAWLDAVAYAVNPSGTVPVGMEASVACVQFKDIGNALNQTELVPLHPAGLDSIFNIDGGDTGCPVLNIASVTTIVASNPLRTQKSVLLFGCLIASGS